MAKMTTDEMIDAFKEMTLSDLSELVDKFEETFDVSAEAPVAVAGAGAAAGAAEGDEEEEQDAFDVVITEIGDKKIQVIKEVRGLTSLGLKEAKELVESAPGTVLEAVDKDEANDAKEQLEGAGATVELQ